MPESVSARIVDHVMARESALAALVAASRPDATRFPIAFAHGHDPQNRFSIKAASTPLLAGLKIGTYWPGNVAQGIPAHSSCILLLDQEAGRVHALVEASRANAFRTAAADALAVECLARPEATQLTIFGAGRQALYEFEAVRMVRPIEHVMVVNRNLERGEELVAAIRAAGCGATLADAATAVPSADIVITATAARAPLFAPELVRPGTHISCMGADGQGKQEVDPRLLMRASLFCDDVEQALSVGELQHIAAEARTGKAHGPVPLGCVLDGRRPGRISAEDVTVFDSSGLGLQDLYLATALLAEAQRLGLAVEV